MPGSSARSVTAFLAFSIASDGSTIVGGMVSCRLRSFSFGSDAFRDLASILGKQFLLLESRAGTLGCHFLAGGRRLNARHTGLVRLGRIRLRGRGMLSRWLGNGF